MRGGVLAITVSDRCDGKQPFQKWLSFWQSMIAFICLKPAEATFAFYLGYGVIFCGSVGATTQGEVGVVT